MRTKTTKYRLFAALLSLCMMFSMFSGILVFATAEDANEAGMCEHHAKHTAECGYAEAVDGQPCTHEHNEECGFAEADEGFPCTHSHDETCGHMEGAAEIPCDLDCTDTDDDGVIDHVDGCAYTPAIESAPCLHEHDDVCGYAAPTEGQPCQHDHDEECGYVEAVEGHPCAFVCESCTDTDDENTEEEPAVTIVTLWNWDDPDEVLLPGAAYGFDDVAWAVSSPNTSTEVLTAILPTQITAILAEGSEENLTVTWDFENPRGYMLPDEWTEGMDEAGLPHFYLYSATLPEGYALDQNATALEVLVMAADTATLEADIVNAFLTDLQVTVTDGGTILDADDKPGNDSSQNNGIVRSFDTMIWDLRVYYAGAEEYAALPANLRVELAGDLTEIEFTMSKMQWLNDWRVDYYDTTTVTEGTTPVLYRDKDGLHLPDGAITTINAYLDAHPTAWLCGDQSSSPYRSNVVKQVLTGSYNLDTTDRSGESQAGGSTLLQIHAQVKAADNGTEFRPSFKTWLDGNPNNENRIGGNELTTNNEVMARLTTVTAAPLYNIRIERATRLAYPGYFDLRTGEEASAGDYDGTNIVRGQLQGFGITLELNNTASGLDNKGLMGVQLPKCPITFSLDLMESEVGGSTQRDDHDGAWNPILWDYIENESYSSYDEGKVTRGKNGRNLRWNDSDYTMRAHWAAPWNSGGQYSDLPNAAYQGGSWKIDGSGRSFSVTVHGFDFDFDSLSSSTNYPDRDVGSEIYGDNRKVPFSSAYVEVLIQFPEEVEKLDNADFSIEAKDMKSNGKTVTEATYEDNKKTDTVYLYPEGTFTKWVNFSDQGARSYDISRSDSWNTEGLGFLGTHYWNGPDNDAVTFMGDTIDMWGAAQYSSKNWANIYALDLLQKFDSAMLSIAGTPSCELIVEMGMDDSSNRMGNVTFLYAVDPKYPQGYDVNKDTSAAQRMNDTTEADYMYYTSLEEIPSGYACVAVLMQLRNCNLVPGTTAQLRVPMLVTDDETYLNQTAETTNIARAWTDKTDRAGSGKKPLADDSTWESMKAGDGNSYPAGWADPDLEKLNSPTFYDKAEHSNTGITGHTAGKQFGMSVLVLSFKAKVGITVTNNSTGETKETASDNKPNFDMTATDENGEAAPQVELTYTLKDISTEVSQQRTYGDAGTGRPENLTIEVDIPDGIDVGSHITVQSNGAASVVGGPVDINYGVPTSVTFYDSETGENYTVTVTAIKQSNGDVTIEIKGAPLNVSLPDISFGATIDKDFVSNNMELTAVATITGEGDGRAPTEKADNNDQATIQISSTGKTAISKQVEQAVIHRNEEIDYSLVYSTDVPVDDGIWFYDILPFPKDQAGVTERTGESNYTGTITVQSVSADTLPENATVTVYYTTADVNTVLASKPIEYFKTETEDSIDAGFPEVLKAAGFLPAEASISTESGSVTISAKENITCVFFFVSRVPANGRVVLGLHTKTDGNFEGEVYYNSFRGQRVNGDINTPVVSNTVETRVIDETALTVEKKVAGDLGAEDEEIVNKTFTFTITGPTATRGEVYGILVDGQDAGQSVTFGQTMTAAVTITGEGKVTIVGLPLGTYKVVESVDGAKIDGYELNVTYDPANGEAVLLTDGDQKTVTVTNTYTDTTTPPPTPETGDLTVSKTVTGNAGDRGKDFHFTVELSDISINGTYGDMIFVNGTATVTLKHGERAMATGLPAGITYTVTETEANQDGYATSVSGGSGTITDGGNAQASFVNSKDALPDKPDEPSTPSTPDKPDEPSVPDTSDTPGNPSDDVPKTGDNSHPELWVTLMLSSAIGLLGVCFFSSTKRKLFSANGRHISK